MPLIGNTYMHLHCRFAEDAAQLAERLQGWQASEAAAATAYTLKMQHLCRLLFSFDLATPTSATNLAPAVPLQGCHALIEDTIKPNITAR